MSHFLEAMMIITFGISWPTNILESYRARTAHGKSLIFLILVLSGYIFGISGKIISGTINYVLVFYIINAIMVSTDMLLYFRNRALDRQNT